MKKLDDIDTAILDEGFDSSDNDTEGFEVLESIMSNTKSKNTAENNIIKTVGNRINETKMIPIVLHTDIFTATQTMVLLNMIRYCMEKSAEGRSGDNKEFSFSVHVQNRSNSDFIVSIGDESQDPIAYQNDVFIGH